MIVSEYFGITLPSLGRVSIAFLEMPNLAVDSRRSTADRLLRSWVGIPPGTWILSVVLSGRCLCDGLITRPEESYRLWRVLVCDYETFWYDETIAELGMQSER